MKKIVLIVSTVLVLIVATYFADKATRVKAVSSVKGTTQPNDAPDGKRAPEVTFKDLNGKDATLAQYKGKVVLVNRNSLAHRNATEVRSEGFHRSRHLHG